MKVTHTNPIIPLNIVANQNGEYRLRLRFNGQIVELTETFNIGDSLQFNAQLLNEDYIYTCVELEHPDKTIEPLPPIQIRIILF